MAASPPQEVGLSAISVFATPNKVAFLLAPAKRDQRSFKTASP